MRQEKISFARGAVLHSCLIHPWLSSAIGIHADALRLKSNLLSLKFHTAKKSLQSRTISSLRRRTNRKLGWRGMNNPRIFIIWIARKDFCFDRHEIISVPRVRVARKTDRG